MKELKTHPIYTDYHCDYFGNIFSTRVAGKLRKLKEGSNPYGHRTVAVRHGKETVRMFSHRFIVECHEQRELQKGYIEVVHHIDGNPANNRISNLELTTQSENVRLGSFRKGENEKRNIYKRGGFYAVCLSVHCIGYYFGRFKSLKQAEERLSIVREFLKLPEQYYGYLLDPEYRLCENSELRSLYLKLKTRLLVEKYTARIGELACA